MKKHIVSTLIIILIVSFNAIAKDNIPNPNNSNNNSYRLLASGCVEATAQSILEVNNVRTTILAGGDMWWDLDNAKYEIPKDSDRHSMFAGALWIGGLDEQGNLKVAAMTYRQDGNDFWPGPLNANQNSINYGTIDATTCAEYDKHYKVTQKQVLEYIDYNNCLSDPDCDISVSWPEGYTTPPDIQNWPASRLDVDGTYDYLAPFTDVDGDMTYIPGIDYPGYDLDQVKDCQTDDILFGDETLWWVFNDNGNIHTESGSESAIGLEIQAQAFGFQTNDEINNMTFYSYKILNRSNQSLNQTYFGQWVDPDLGEYQDDYVGCDVGLGLGYCYNGDSEDEGVSGYNYDSDDPPPAIGVDFFRGPLADPFDGIDNDRDGEIDEPEEQIIMSKFVYYNNDFSEHGNPESANHYYGYLRGIWKDGQPMTYGGTGWEEANPECNFMFPDDTDTENAALYGPWTEITAGNPVNDRRFLQSSGPFTLEPGAVNYITTGVVWARASEGNNFASVELMKIADKKAQKLFDICFEVIDGPSAPDMNFVELDKELIINLTYEENSNNYANQYSQLNPFISDVLQTNLIGYEGEYEDEDGNIWTTGPIYEEGTVDIDKHYRFEGYQVFQLKNSTVTQTDLYNPDKARMVYQCDIENYRTPTGDIVSIPSDDTTPIASLVNYNLDETVGPNVYVPQNMTLSAANSGISNSFRITEDEFATGNKALVNNKPYYYMVIAYAYNEYIPYSPEIPFSSATPYAPSNEGQKEPYLAGRKNIKVYTAIPHKIESFGNIPTAEYGTRPAQTGLAGRGNGGNFLEISPANREAIALNSFSGPLSYRKNMSPLDISVVDPLSVPNANFIFRVLADDTLMWSVDEGVDLTSSNVGSGFDADCNPVSLTSIQNLDLNNPDADKISNTRWSLTMVDDNGNPIPGEPPYISGSSLIDNAQEIIPNWGLAVRFKATSSIETGQLDMLGCLTCAKLPAVSNNILDGLLWDHDSLSIQEIETIVEGSIWQQAVDNMWLSPMPDLEVWTDSQFAFSRPNDWVRSGSNAFSPGVVSEATRADYSDISRFGAPLDPTSSVTNKTIPLDENNVHEGQWLVPYKLVSSDYKSNSFSSSTENEINTVDNIGGGLAYHLSKELCSLDNLNNVDLVLTNDKDLWTRCPVLDMSEVEFTWNGSGEPVSNNSTPSSQWVSGDELGPWVKGDGTGEHGEEKWDLRLDLNVGKDGEPDGTGCSDVINSDNGWGWFPGYAVDVSTGKRLNLMFSENSSLGEEYNGNDMQFNPTSDALVDTDGDGFPDFAPMNGGHAVFILDTEYQGDILQDNPHYGNFTGNPFSAWNSLRKSKVIPHIQWVGYWLANEEQAWLGNEVVIRARVHEAYGYRSTSTNTTVDGEVDLLNEGYPYYRFNTADMYTILDDDEAKKGAMEDINIVPNPYYGMSGYEDGQVDTRVKITNLPPTCTISIYTINGNLIRQYKKDSEDSYLEWDLKNEYGIQIASGMYIIYIDAGEIGEKTLKWFGALRPIDLNTF